MLRLSFVIAFFFTVAACNGCGDSSSTDGSATVQDAGVDDGGDQG